jgi:hypothetical protein
MLFKLMKNKSIYISILLTIVASTIGWLYSIEPASAAYCQRIANHDICIVKIARSAKNYWQYNAIVSVDGVRRSMATYNCRDRYLLNADGTTLSFDRDPSSAIVCRLYS